MSGVSLLLLPLIAGYAFSRIWAGSIYHASRESGHRLYLRSAFYAVFLVACGALLHIKFYCDHSWYASILEFLSVATNAPNPGQPPAIFSPISHTSIAMMAFVLGPTLAHIVNIPEHYQKLWAEYEFLPKIPAFNAWQRLLLSRAIGSDDFEVLLYNSFLDGIPVLFTQSTGKVFVGWLVQAPNPAATRRSVALLPMLSGFRDPITQRVSFTTNYLPAFNEVQEFSTDLLNHLDLTDFIVVMPLEQITSAHLFDLEAYELMKSRERGDGADADELLRWKPSV